MRRLRVYFPLSLCLFLNGCAVVHPPDKITYLHPALIHEVVGHLDRSMQDGNLQRINGLLSPSIHVAFMDANQDVMAFHGLEYYNLVRDVLLDADGYASKRGQSTISIGRGGKIAAHTSHLSETLELHGELVSSDAVETLTLEVIDGKPMITAISSVAVTIR